MHQEQIYIVEVSKLSFGGLVTYFFAKKESADKFAENAQSVGFPSVVKEYSGDKPLFVYEG